MKKRNIAISILVGVCACFASVGLMACGGVGESSVYSENCKMELSFDKSYYIVTDVEDHDCKELVIPSEYKGKPVKEIGPSAFEDCRSLTSIDIPDSVTSIGRYAFDSCSSLTSVEIPDSVTSIGYSAFYNCSNLTSVEIPDSVTSIGDRAFYSCDSLTSVVIGDRVTSIGEGAFYSCDGLTEVIFEDTRRTWYSVYNYADWENKTGGSEMDVTDSAANATYFKSTYYDYYWYKL